MSTAPPPFPTPPGRPRRRPLRRGLVVAGAAAALTLGGGLGVGLGGGSSAEDAEPAASTARPGMAVQNVNAASGPLAAEVARLQRRLGDLPQDASGWAALGSAYIQAARISSDPAYYPKAEGALARALQLRPRENLAAFLGMGALANARHDFTGALEWAARARAVSPYNPDVYGVLADAYTQLGRPAAATAAIQRMLDLSPTLPALARASYDLEQRGKTGAAGRLLGRALAGAYAGPDIGFCRYHLGELAFNAGNLAAAAGHYEAGLAADPTSAPLLQGRAKTAALAGDTTAALRDYAVLVARVPNPQYLVEYAELLAAVGRSADAAQQLTLVSTVHALFTANGGRDDLSLAEYEADHGSPARALGHARAEWARRQSPPVADAMAWALHKNGRHAQALVFADRALAHGWRNALFAHHRSEIHAALGNRSAAAADAALAKAFNPRFDPRLPSLGRSL